MSSLGLPNIFTVASAMAVTLFLGISSGEVQSPETTPPEILVPEIVQPEELPPAESEEEESQLEELSPEEGVEEEQSSEETQSEEEAFVQTLPETAISTVLWEEEQILAVIQLSQHYEQLDYTQEISSSVQQYFPDIQGSIIPEYVFDGYETYFVIPRDPDEKISVYDYVFTEADLEKGDLLLEIQGEKAFTIRCNVSDLFPNLLLEVGEKSLTLSTSLKDGSLQESPYLQEVFLEAYLVE
ncbi:MAG: hypothetical protein R3Y63_02125 [Eubacteriales bacterium]